MKTIKPILMGLGLLNVISGGLVWLTKNYTLLPLLFWVQSLSRDQVERYVEIWARGLILLGLACLLLSAIIMFGGRRKAR
jgi:hypothetical protein